MSGMFRDGAVTPEVSEQAETFTLSIQGRVSTLSIETTDLKQSSQETEFVPFTLNFFHVFTTSTVKTHGIHIKAGLRHGGHVPLSHSKTGMMCCCVLNWKSYTHRELDK